MLRNFFLQGLFPEQVELKTDIAKYFDSIDHDILLNFVEKNVKIKKFSEDAKKDDGVPKRSDIGRKICNEHAQHV